MENYMKLKILKKEMRNSKKSLQKGKVLEISKLCVKWELFK